MVVLGEATNVAGVVVGLWIVGVVIGISIGMSLFVHED